MSPNYSGQQETIDWRSFGQQEIIDQRYAGQQVVIDRRSSGQQGIIDWRPPVSKELLTGDLQSIISTYILINLSYRFAFSGFGSAQLVSNIYPLVQSLMAEKKAKKSK